MLLVILAIIAKKVRSSNERIKKKYQRFKKLTRALFILFPLLGLTFGMFIWIPYEHKTLLSVAYFYFNIFLQTTQGMWVAIVYCFFNEDVKKILKKKFKNWKLKYLNRKGTYRIPVCQSSSRI